MLTPQDVVRRIVKADGAQVGRFSSWGTALPKGFLAENAYFSLCTYKSLNHVIFKEAVLVLEGIRVEQRKPL